MSLTRHIKFLAAWDKRNPPPAPNYGVNGVEISFLLTGPEGAVHVKLMTDWMLPEVQREHEELAKAHPGLPHPELRRVNGLAFLLPVSVHSKAPREGDWTAKEKCDFLEGPCWAISLGFVPSDPIWEKMLREGDTGFWASLEEIYRLNLVV